jgi:CheY-like chemotaxis protein
MLEIRVGSAPSGPDFPWETINSLAPHLIWGGLIVFVLLWIGRQRLIGLLERVEKLNLGGVEIGFQRKLEKVAEQKDQNLSLADLGHASRRLANSSHLTKDSKILWVDDQPENNELEAALLREAGASVEMRRSTDEAMQALKDTVYDVILSDVARPEGEKAGLLFAEDLSRQRDRPPIILYVGRAEKPVPSCVFGLTDRPDELVHLVLDVLARKRS